MYYSTIKEKNCINAIFDFDGVLGDFMIKVAVCGYGNLGKAVEKKAIESLLTLLPTDTKEGDLI